jgi:hypothetical protein
MPRKQKKYHYIYRTTCQITGKFYIGMHSTDNLEDGYLGSGKILGYSIGKHGRENHKREIVEFVENREALKLREAEIVNEELLAHPLNINLKYGGEGGWDHIDGANLISEKFLAYKNSGQLAEVGRKAFANFTFEQKHKRAKNAWANNRESMTKAALIGVNAMAAPAANAKRKQTMVLNAHSQGTKNSQYGTCWVSLSGKAIKIQKIDLDEYLAKGYNRGRKGFQ